MKKALVLVGLLLVAAAVAASPWVSVKTASGYGCKAPTGQVFPGVTYPTKSNATIQCNVLTPFLDWLVGPSADAATIRTRTIANANGVQDVGCPLGDCTPSPASYAWDATALATAMQAVVSRTTGTGAVSINIKQYCTGVDCASTTLTLTNAVANWSISGGTNLAHAGVATGNSITAGPLQFTLTFMGVPANSATFVWSWAAPPVTTCLPNPPLGLEQTANTTGDFTLVFDPSMSPNNSACTSSPIHHYNVKVNGSTVTTVTAASGGFVPTWTATNLGSASGTNTCTPTLGQISCTGGGAGLEGTADQLLFYNTPFSGNGFISGRITSLTIPGTYNKTALGFRNTLSADSAGVNLDYLSIGSPFPAEYDLQSRNRSAAAADRSNATPSTVTADAAPIFEKIAYSASGANLYYSTNGGPWQAKYSNLIPGLTGSKYAGLYVTATMNGTNATAVVDYLTASADAQLSKVVSGNAGGTCTVTAVDTAGNESVALAGITCAQASAPPPVTTAKKWHPGVGHVAGLSYNDSVGSCTGAGPVTTTCFNEGTANRWAIYDTMASVSQVKYVKFDVPWTFLEGATAGDFSPGIARMHSEINKLQGLAAPKRMYVRMSDEKEGASSNYMKVLPQYLGTVGCLASNNAAGVGGNTGITRLKMWDVTCRQYWKNLWTAYSWLDDEVSVEAITVVTETSITDSSELSGYSDAGYVAGLEDMMLFLKNTFPKTNVVLEMNYMERKQDLDTLAAYAYSIGVALGNVDSTPALNIWGYQAYLGTLCPSGSGNCGSSVSVNYVGAIPWYASTESSQLGTGAQPTHKPQVIWDWANNTMHTPLMIWDRQNFTVNCNYVTATGASDGFSATCVPTRWSTVGGMGLLDFTIAHPTPTFTACPTRYDTLFGNGSVGSGCNTN